MSTGQPGKFLKAVNTSRLSLRGLVVFAVLLILPVRIIVAHYAPDSGFLGLISFGRAFTATRLAPIDALDPPTLSRYGYNGQF